MPGRWRAAGSSRRALRYVTQVVRAWEASIYGGRTLSAAMGEALCTGFAQRLDASAPAGAGSGT